MLVFIKNSLQTQCEFCKKNFKSLGRHVWRCQARLLNRETTIDSIIITSKGQSSVTSNNKDTSVNLFNNDYDPHESEEKDHRYRCYCGREFTLTLMRTFIQSIPEITTDHIPKNILKAGIKLPLFNYFFALNYRKLEATNTALEQKHKNCTRNH